MIGFIKVGLTDPMHRFAVNRTFRLEQICHCAMPMFKDKEIIFIKIYPSAISAHELHDFYERALQYIINFNRMVDRFRDSIKRNKLTALFFKLPAVFEREKYTNKADNADRQNADEVHQFETVAGHEMSGYDCH